MSATCGGKGGDIAWALPNVASDIADMAGDVAMSLKAPAVQAQPGWRKGELPAMSTNVAADVKGTRAMSPCR